MCVVTDKTIVRISSNEAHTHTIIKLN